MSIARLDTQAPSSAALTLPAQVAAARQQQNSVAPRAADIAPPERPAEAARAGLDIAREAPLGSDSERRPPPPLKEYARIPTKMTAEILRLQQEALEKADEASEAESRAERARADATSAAAAARAAGPLPAGDGPARPAAAAATSPGAPAATVATVSAAAEPPGGLAAGLGALNAAADPATRLDRQA